MCVKTLYFTKTNSVVGSHTKKHIALLPNFQKKQKK